ncbi:MAG TPA: hypothetical protein VFI31_19245, partial [Pirellulales bacterium]|nr:hypothetical protein [Pirellulales bacterium]
NFTLNTYLGGTQSAAGAIPGDYKVAVQKREVAGGGGDAEPPPVSEAESSASAPSAPGGGAPTGMAGYLSGSRAAGKAVIPEIYADAEKSGLEATVKPSGNEPFKFDLKD